MNHKEFAAGFSTTGLLMMHKGLRDSFEKDESTPAGHEKPYGVRTYADWRMWSDALEGALTDRGVPFQPIPW